MPVSRAEVTLKCSKWPKRQILVQDVEVHRDITWLDHRCLMIRGDSTILVFQWLILGLRVKGWWKSEKQCLIGWVFSLKMWWVMEAHGGPSYWSQVCRWLETSPWCGGSRDFTSSSISYCLYFVRLVHHGSGDRATSCKNNLIIKREKRAARGWLHVNGEKGGQRQLLYLPKILLSSDN